MKIPEPRPSVPVRLEAYKVCVEEDLVQGHKSNCRGSTSSQPGPAGEQAK